MISKHILSAPKNDNYARLANYIAAGHEYSMDIQNEERIYDPQRNVSASQGVAGNRLRQLSECRLASYFPDHHRNGELNNNKLLIMYARTLLYK